MRNKVDGDHFCRKFGFTSRQSGRIKQTDSTWAHVYAWLGCSFDEFLQYYLANHMQGVLGEHIGRLVYACELAWIKLIVLGEKGKGFMPPIWELVK